MRIEINEQFYLDSERRNWLVRAGDLENSAYVAADDNDAPVEMEDFVGRFRELQNLIDDLQEGHSSLANKVTQRFRRVPLQTLCDAIDGARHELEAAFATPLRPKEIVALNIPQFVLLSTAEWPGYAFRLADRLNLVHRREWQHSEQRWKSKNYYTSLGRALGETLVERCRVSRVAGLDACLAEVAKLRGILLSCRRYLPEAYFGGVQVSPAAAINSPDKLPPALFDGVEACE